MRIHVIGTTGSGKSTLAARLAGQLSCPHIELDALFWGPDWTPVPRDTFIARVDEALAAEAWVIDGNYHGALGTRIWTQAETVVWLDYALPVTVWRLFRRTIRRSALQEELWGSGNRESWRKSFLSRDSILLYALQTHKRRRTQYAALIADPAYAHLTVIRLPSPAAAEAWLGEVGL